MPTVVISGASGAVIGVRLIEDLLRTGSGVMAVVTDAGRVPVERDSDYRMLRIFD